MGFFPVVLMLPLMAAAGGDRTPSTEPQDGTRVVLLGTGNPRPDPDRSGPATAVVVNGSAYLVDFGPGVVRRAAEAARVKGIAAVEPTNLKVVFVTHLHSDHTAGYPDLILTTAKNGRSVPLEVYGPKGIKSMTEHVLAAYREDIEIRTKGLENASPEGFRVNTHEIAPGIVYKDGQVTVTAFHTKHGEWRETYGYRFDSRDRRIVISGDTTPAQAVIDACQGCDILIHEALTMKFLSNPGRRGLPGADVRKYAGKYHTTTHQLAKLAAKAKPGLLVLYHNPITLQPIPQPFASTPDDLLREIREGGYNGRVTVGRDLDVF